MRERNLIQITLKDASEGFDLCTESHEGTQSHTRVCPHTDALSETRWRRMFPRKTRKLLNYPAVLSKYVAHLAA